MAERYPRVEVDLAKLKNNVEYVVSRCGDYGIDVCGVIKGCTAYIPAVRQFAEGGCKWIASSRLEQIEDCVNAGIDKPMMLIRIPMLSEAPEVIRLTDYSLNSSIEVIRALNEEAKKQDKLHKVILMADLGDLREGFWDKDEMVDVACDIENNMKYLELAGVGTNLGCYGSIAATVPKLQELVDIAERIEAKIGRELEVISGGATSSFMRVVDGNIPSRINMLRIGEGILLSRDWDVFYGYKQEEMYQDTFVVKAEVIEVKDKPTYPVGEFAVDAFGHKPTYTDRGIRRRALLALGKVDYGDCNELIPNEEGIEVLGASSDHTIIDVEDCKRDLKVGDIVSFTINYATLVFLTNTRNVEMVSI